MGKKADFEPAFLFTYNEGGDEMSMEKYGAEIQTYQVIERKDGSSSTRVVGEDLSLDDATKLAKESIDYVVKPS